MDAAHRAKYIVLCPRFSGVTVLLCLIFKGIERVVRLDRTVQQPCRILVVLDVQILSI